MTGTEQEHFKYLNELRQSGVTNMLGAGPYLVGTFNMTSEEARKTLCKWIDSFEKEVR